MTIQNATDFPYSTHAQLHISSSDDNGDVMDLDEDWSGPVNIEALYQKDMQAMVATTGDGITKDFEACNQINAELAKQVATGCQKSRDLMFHRHMKLVPMVLSGFSWNTDDGDMDLIQEGNFGLLQAVDNWSPDFGPFPAFAKRRIRGAMHDACNQGKDADADPVHVPRRRKAAQRQLAAALSRLEQRHDRHPSIRELAAEVDMPEDEVHDLLASDMWSEELTDEHMSAFQAAAETDLHYNQLEQMVSDSLQTLTDREREVLVRRYGLLNAPLHKPGDIAQSLAISGARVRKLTATGLDRVKAHDDNNGGHLRAHWNTM